MKSKIVKTWNKVPMPTKIMLMLWDGKVLWGPVAPQNNRQRKWLQKHYKATHWMELPPAPIKPQPAAP